MMVYGEPLQALTATPLTGEGNEALSRAALALRQAELERHPCAPLRDRFPGLGVEEAYRIQALNVEARTAAGARILGRKIGLTSRAVQRQLGVDEPDFGTLLDDMELADGGELPIGRTIQPKAEAEIAFVLDRTLAEEDVPESEVAAAIAFALPAIEIVDSRIRDWDIRLVDTVADNGSAAFYVLGRSPRSIERLDLDLCGMALTRGEELVSTGVGRACLGHPLNALTWLARKMARMGSPLREGEVVLSGALGQMVPVRGGDCLTASIGGLGEVRVAFSAEE